MLTTTEAAAALDITRRQVVNLIKAGKIQATKPGRDWQVDRASVEGYKTTERKVGRPRKRGHNYTDSERSQDTVIDTPHSDA